MNDLISRQAAIDALAELARDSFTIKDTFQIYLDALKDADLKIRQMSTAEPKKGKWIPVTNGRGGHECDQCHEYAPSWQTGEERLTNYCPNCGARMEE